MLSIILLVCLWFAHGAKSHDWGILDNNNGQWSEVVQRDVCVVGGGSSGVHAAVSLKDLNKTVAVVERRDRLGGDTHTYLCPGSVTPLDIGVVFFQPLKVVYDYFQKFDVPLLNVSSVQPNIPGQPANKSQPAITFATIPIDLDFRDGTQVIPHTDTSSEVGAALMQMSAVLSQYDYVFHGYDLPDPVPEDLYMPYGAFIEKYNLTAAFDIVHTYSQGMGDLLHVPTIYAVKYFGIGDIQALSQGFLTHAHGNNSELYSKAGEYISEENIFLESIVVSSRRENSTYGDTKSQLLISTKDQGLKLLSCGQVVLAIPPDPLNLAGWDLTEQEHEVFSSFTTANGYWTGLVSNVGLNQTTTLWNAAADTPFNIPVLPALYALSPVGVIDDVWWIKFGANNPDMSDEQVKAYVEREIRTLQLSLNATVTEIEWLIFESHSPFHRQVPPEAIKNGFFKQLTALQGGLGGTMFYTGAAFHAQHSSLLWRFNEEVLIPKMKEHW